MYYHSRCCRLPPVDRLRFAPHVRQCTQPTPRRRSWNLDWPLVEVVVVVVGRPYSSALAVGAADVAFAVVECIPWPLTSRTGGPGAPWALSSVPTQGTGLRRARL